MAKRKDKTPAQPAKQDSGSSSGGSSRSRTIERRQERERQKRRQQQVTLVGVVAALAVIAVVLIFSASQPAEAPIPEASATRYADVAQSKTEDGYPLLGDPKSAVQVVEYSSFDCPHCGDFHEEVFPALIERVKAGEIAFTYVPLFGTGGIPNGEGAARAALCAGEQGKFWPLHDAFYSWQKTFGQQAFSQNRILGALENLGINRAQYDQCFNGSLPGSVLDAARADAIALGDDFKGTPAVFVNGVFAQPTLSDVNAAIDAALALVGERATPEVTAEASPEATDEATAAPTTEATDEATSEATPEATAGD